MDISPQEVVEEKGRIEKTYIFGKEVILYKNGDTKLALVVDDEPTTWLEILQEIYEDRGRHIFVPVLYEAGLIDEDGYLTREGKRVCEALSYKTKYTTRGKRSEIPRAKVHSLSRSKQQSREGEKIKREEILPYALINPFTKELKKDLRRRYIPTPLLFFYERIKEICGEEWRDVLQEVLEFMKERKFIVSQSDIYCYFEGDEKKIKTALYLLNLLKVSRMPLPLRGIYEGVDGYEGGIPKYVVRMFRKSRYELIDQVKKLPIASDEEIKEWKEECEKLCDERIMRLFKSYFSYFLEEGEGKPTVRELLEFMKNPEVARKVIRELVRR